MVVLKHRKIVSFQQNCDLHGNNKDKTKKLFLLGEGTKIKL